MQVYKVKRNQNIFDVAVSTHGSIEGIFNLLINNPDLSFHSQLKEDEEIYWDEEFIIYDSIVNTLQSEHIVPANGERHVYHKSTTASLRCVVYISPKEASIALQMAGDGNLIVDWGDNSDLDKVQKIDSREQFYKKQIQIVDAELEKYQKFKKRAFTGYMEEMITPQE